MDWKVYGRGFLARVGPSIFKRHEYSSSSTKNVEQPKNVDQPSQITIWVVKCSDDDLEQDNGQYIDMSAKNKAWEDYKDENHRFVGQKGQNIARNRIFNLVDSGTLMRKYRGGSTDDEHISYILQSHMTPQKGETENSKVVLIIRTMTVFDFAVRDNSTSARSREMEFPTSLSVQTLNLLKNEIIKMIEIIIHDWTTEKNDPQQMIVRLDEFVTLHTEDKTQGPTIKRQKKQKINPIFSVLGNEILIGIFQFKKCDYVEDMQNTTVINFTKVL